MSNIYYSIIGLLAIIIYLIVNHDYYLHKDDRKDVKDYKNYLSVIFLYFLTDVAWGIFNALNMTAWLYIDSILYHVCMALSVVLCCKYIVSYLNLDGVLRKAINVFGCMFMAGDIILLFVNHFYHVLFWFDENGEYEKHTMRDAALIVLIFMFVFICLMTLRAMLKSEGNNGKRNMVISIYALVMTVALVAQYFFPLLPLYSVGLLLGMLIIYVFIRNEDLNAHLRQIEKLNAQMMAEQKELQEQRDELITAFSIINALSLDFHTIWLFDKETRKMRMIREPGKGVIKDSISLALECTDCDEAMRMYIDNFVSDEDKERMREQVTVDKVLEQLSKTNFFAVNYMRRKQDGETDYNQMAFANADTPDGKRQFVFGFRDVNDILQQEYALRREINEAKLAAEAANAAKTSFLFNMSHDIRTPMNAIMGFRDLLEKNQEDAEKRANYLKKIEESSNVLLSIINNVLEMARIEKGVLQLNESVWSAEQFNDSLYSVFIDMMEEKGLTFTTEIDVQHHFVYCDPIKLREIFINILSNAYKYTNPGGKVSMTLTELPSDKEGYAKFQTTISDTGIGMSEEFLPHLFEEFSREHNMTDSKVEGTGLGMPIVKRFVEFMGGEIDVKSEKNVGTTFVVTLYHRISDKSTLIQNDVETGADYFEGKRLLLAEDNELNAEIAVAVLSELGFTVDVAVDGQECVDKLVAVDAGYYDAILMDIQMPRMNGYEATKAIRALEDERKARIVILAMTANAFEEDKREAIAAGMNGHLSKPINVRELTRALAVSLAGKK